MPQVFSMGLGCHLPQRAIVHVVGIAMWWASPCGGHRHVVVRGFVSMTADWCGHRWRHGR